MQDDINTVPAVPTPMATDTRVARNREDGLRKRIQVCEAVVNALFKELHLLSKRSSRMTRGANIIIRIVRGRYHQALHDLCRLNKLLNQCSP